MEKVNLIWNFSYVSQHKPGGILTSQCTYCPLVNDENVYFVVQEHFQLPVMPTWPAKVDTFYNWASGVANFFTVASGGCYSTASSSRCYLQVSIPAPESYKHQACLFSSRHAKVSDALFVSAKKYKELSLCWWGRHSNMTIFYDECDGQGCYALNCHFAFLGCLCQHSVPELSPLKDPPFKDHPFSANILSWRVLVWFGGICGKISQTLAGSWWTSKLMQMFCGHSLWYVNLVNLVDLVNLVNLMDINVDANVLRVFSLVFQLGGLGQPGQPCVHQSWCKCSAGILSGMSTAPGAHLDAALMFRGNPSQE